MFPKDLTPQHLNIISQDTLLTHLGISFTEIGEDYIMAKMPVKDETSQPMGILHGGASVSLAALAYSTSYVDSIEAYTNNITTYNNLKVLLL